MLMYLRAANDNSHEKAALVHVSSMRVTIKFLHSSIWVAAAVLNSQSRRQIGHFCSSPPAWSHLLIHWRWKAWLHVPQTTALSSPGNFESGGHPSNGALQIPQTSSPAANILLCSIPQWYTYIVIQTRPDYGFTSTRQNETVGEP